MTKAGRTGPGGTQRIRDVGWDKEHAAGPEAVGSDGKTERGSLKAPHEQSGSRRGMDKERARRRASAHHPGRGAQPRGRGGRRCPPAPPWRPAERPIVPALRRSAWLSKRTVRLLVARLSLRRTPPCGRPLSHTRARHTRRHTNNNTNTPRSPRHPRTPSRTDARKTTPPQAKAPPIAPPSAAGSTSPTTLTRRRARPPPQPWPARGTRGRPRTRRGRADPAHGDAAWRRPAAHAAARSCR